MEILKKKNGLIEYKENELELSGFEILDSNSVHLTLGGNTYCFLIDETDLDGVVYKDSQSFIDSIYA